MTRLLIVLLAITGVSRAQWGRDVNPGLGKQLSRSVERDLAALVSGEMETQAFIDRHAGKRIEAIKRFRNPELKALFTELCEHRDWQIQHRALLALEYYRDAAAIEPALRLLGHPHRRMREKASIACIKLWKPGRPRPDGMDALLSGERDLHVRGCLEALDARIRGDLRMERVHTEHLERQRNGLLWTPYLSTMQEAARVAPGYTASEWSRSGSGKPPRAAHWTTPLLAFGEELVPGAPLQPFGSLGDDGALHHVGEDVGACLDGAGYYAVAEGVVRLIQAGGGVGTVLVVEHDLGGGERVNAVYMHGGDTTFVRAGDVVRSGQLLGTMGMSYSIENGARFAHLHFGLYLGPFDQARSVSYRKVRDGLGDWLEPIPFLESWIDRTRPVIEELRPLGRQVSSILARIERGEFGRAYLEAHKLREASQAGSEAYVDSLYLEDVLKRAPKSALALARKSREAGYPNEAARRLRAATENCREIPGAEELKTALREWEADPQFAKALRGESRIQYTAARIAKLKDPAKARQLWERLLEQYADTCLAPRIRRRVPRTLPRRPK